MISKAFILSAGFGTRFRPQTNFIPKPAIPFFNLPMALYPVSLLKTLGVSDFFYNSHHLPDELDASLEPFLNKKSMRESPILDSAGGILNSKNDLDSDDNFFVVNGDSFIACEQIDLINECITKHIKNDYLATFFCIPKSSDIKSGLDSDSEGNMTGISGSETSKHFIGLYILNKRIFSFIKSKPSHIFKDVILPLLGKEKIIVANLEKTTRWYETGSEESFIKAHILESAHIFNKTDKSFVYKTHSYFNKDAKTDLYNFLNNKVWGMDHHAHPKSIFTCVPKKFNGKIKLLKNCVVATSETLPDEIFENKVLVDASQWNI